MNKISSFFVILLCPIASIAQYCTSIGPTTTIDSNVESVSLIGDGDNINFVGCPGQIGLEDHTNLNTTLTAGNMYTTHIQFGTCGGNYAGNGEAWIDFNHNQIFEVGESIGTWSGTPPTPMSSFNFTVPAGSINGTTRMRVMQRENGSLPLDPCDGFQWGSVMDFSITITGGIDCSGHIGNTADDAIIMTQLPYSNTHDNSVCYNNNNYAYPSPDVFYLLVPDPQTQTVTFSLCGSTFDTFISVFDTDGNTVDFNDDSSCGAASEVTVSTIDYDSLYIVVEGWGYENGAYTLTATGTFLSTETINTEDLKIFPNPSQEEIQIKGIYQPVSLDIFSAEGQLIQTIVNYQGKTIDISHLSQGLYFIQIHAHNSTITKKLIKR